MTTVEIMPARLADVWAFERMRPEDAAEVMASHGLSPVEAIIESWANSKEAWTVRFNGEVAAMYGIVLTPWGTALTPVAVGWLLTTTAVDRHPVTFFKESKRIVKELAERYGVLTNFVDARYGKALNWARRLGFDVQQVITFGRNGEPFNPISYGG